MAHALDFSPEWSSVFWSNFTVCNKDAPVPAHMQSILKKVTLSSPEQLKGLRIAEMHIKNDLWLENVDWWQDTSTDVGIYNFKTSHHVHCALRFDMTRNAFSKFGRKNLPIQHMPNFLPHAHIPYAEEASRRWIIIENALGFISIVNQKGGYIFFVIVEVFMGWIRMPENISKEVAIKMAQILSHVHNQWVLHMHPHGNNWILIDGQPKLVDGKAILLSQDFPHKASTNRVITADMRQEWDKDIVIEDFFLKPELKEEKEAFLDTYYSLRQKT